MCYQHLLKANCIDAAKVIEKYLDADNNCFEYSLLEQFYNDIEHNKL